MPAKRIIILDRSQAEAGAETRLRYVMWADVPVNFQPFYPLKPIIRSAFNGASADENNAITSGAVAEIEETQTFDSGTTLNQVRNFLENRWTNFQDKVTNNNPAVSRGVYWNGTSWKNRNE